MDDELKEMLNRIRDYSINSIIITDYCKEKIEERNIEKSLLTSTLFSDDLYYFEK
ncbi:MAG: hypothetical protein ABIB79_00305 [archaeon]